MKKIFTIAAIAAATILSASCAKEREGELQKEGIIAHASLQPVEATKASGQYSYNIVWDKGDKISVLDNAKTKATFVLTAGDGTTTGTFQQEGTDALTAPLTAYYPASVVAGDKSLVWPATQADVKNISNVPMTAESTAATEDVNFAFKHLGSVLQLVLSARNGTIDVKQIDITADQGLSGAFTVENGTAVISNTGTTISTGDISAESIKLTATASYLNFAVPAGDYTNFKITITDTNDKAYSLSAASLTLKCAMVNKVTFAMDAKNDAIYELNVNGHTVRVKLAEVSGIEKDIMVTAYADGASVVIKAQAESGRPVECVLSDDKLCDFTKNNNIYTFTISDITSDLTATVGYTIAHSVSLNKNALNLIKEYGHYRLVATVLPEDAEDKTSLWSSSDESVATVDQNGFVQAFATGSATITAKTIIGGHTATCSVTVVEPQSRPDGALPGHFSVSDNTVVYFSKGNLYCSGAIFNGDGTVSSIHGATWGFETHQYDTTPSAEGSRDNSHISHFMWCKDASNSLSQHYDIGWSGDGYLFTNKDATTPSTDFAVNGQKGIWRALSGGEYGELRYLINRKNKTLYKTGVTVCNNTNCLILLPDDWKWDANTVGTGWQTEYSESTTVKWSTMEAAGAVCLPAAGFRVGYNGDVLVNRVGSIGIFWSSSSDLDGVSELLFNDSGINLDRHDDRNQALSVRLVTEYK